MSQQSGAYQDMTKRSRRTAIAQVAAHRLVSKAMQLRINTIKNLIIINKKGVTSGLTVNKRIDS